MIEPTDEVKEGTQLIRYDSHRLNEKLVLVDHLTLGGRIVIKHPRGHTEQFYPNGESVHSHTEGRFRTRDHVELATPERLKEIQRKNDAFMLSQYNHWGKLSADQLTRIRAIVMEEKKS